MSKNLFNNKQDRLKKYKTKNHLRKHSLIILSYLLVSSASWSMDYDENNRSYAPFLPQQKFDYTTLFMNDYLDYNGSDSVSFSPLIMEESPCMDNPNSYNPTLTPSAESYSAENWQDTFSSPSPVASIQENFSSMINGGFTNTLNPLTSSSSISGAYVSTNDTQNGTGMFQLNPSMTTQATPPYAFQHTHDRGLTEPPTSRPLHPALLTEQTMTSPPVKVKNSPKTSTFTSGQRDRSTKSSENTRKRAHSPSSEREYEQQQKIPKLSHEKKSMQNSESTSSSPTSSSSIAQAVWRDVFPQQPNVNRTNPSSVWSIPQSETRIPLMPQHQLFSRSQELFFLFSQFFHYFCTTLPAENTGVVPYPHPLQPSFFTQLILMNNNQRQTYRQTSSLMAQTVPSSTEIVFSNLPPQRHKNGEEQRTIDEKLSPEQVRIAADMKITELISRIRAESHNTSEQSERFTDREKEVIKALWDHPFKPNAQNIQEIFKFNIRTIDLKTVKKHIKYSSVRDKRSRINEKSISHLNRLVKGA